MITNFFISELNNHDFQELWFQQDGATCHTARATIDLLKDTFGDRLISRFGPVNWPPRSCDLTPLDYFLSFIREIQSVKNGASKEKIRFFSQFSLINAKIPSQAITIVQRLLLAYVDSTTTHSPISELENRRMNSTIAVAIV
ncbi:uncharacterized protein TNCV_2585571 [Trichonephila clavipes]|nr:uncharacterized protein TNCV_2585571 [Trichonephila clavipes]